MELKGAEYKGDFSPPHGVGGNVWFLTVNKRHWGQLILKAIMNGAFYNNQDTLKELSDDFGDVLRPGRGEEVNNNAFTALITAIIN